MEQLICELYNINCIKLGDFQIKEQETYSNYNKF